MNYLQVCPLNKSHSEIDLNTKSMCAMLERHNTIHMTIHLFYSKKPVLSNTGVHVDTILQNLSTRQYRLKGINSKPVMF